MYIDFKHISIDGLKINEEISNLLDKYNIKTYEDLSIEFFKKNKELISNHFLTKAFSDARRIMFKQESGIDAYNEHLSIVSAQKTSNLQLFDIDELVRVIDLPLYIQFPQIIRNAVSGYTFSFYKDKEDEYLKKCPVSYLKKVLMETRIVDGVATPRIIVSRSGIGEVKYNQLMATLNFYDKYVEQLLKAYPGCENPFYYMQEEKLQLVREKRKEIFSYLNSEGYEFIFGDISKVMCVLDFNIPAAAKRKLLAIENVIANYVTFEEALDIENPKVLNKFIVPYGKK